MNRTGVPGNATTAQMCSDLPGVGLRGWGSTGWLPRDRANTRQPKAGCAPLSRRPVPPTPSKSRTSWQCSRHQGRAAAWIAPTCLIKWQSIKLAANSQPIDACTRLNWPLFYPNALGISGSRCWRRLRFQRRGRRRRTLTAICRPLTRPSCAPPAWRWMQRATCR